MGTTTSRMVPSSCRRYNSSSKDDPLALTKHKPLLVAFDSHSTIDTWIDDIGSINHNCNCPSSPSSPSSADHACSSTVLLEVDHQDDEDHENDDEEFPEATATTITKAEEKAAASSMFVSDCDADGPLFKKNDRENVGVKKATKVKFSTIEQRVYPIIPSDNPSVTGFGPAMELGGWQYETQALQGIDDYESKRLSVRRTQPEDLKLPAVERQERLLEQGASRNELKKCSKEVQKLKTKRLQTQEAYHMYGGQAHLNRLEQMEKSKRYVQKLLGLRRTHQVEEAKLWEQAAIAAAAATNKE